MAEIITISVQGKLPPPVLKFGANIGAE